MRVSPTEGPKEGDATMETTKRCVACRMEIHAEAEKCPHCRTRQVTAAPMHRGVPGRMIAGVCAAIGTHLGVDPALVRVVFVMAALFSGGVVIGAYLFLWAITPPSPAAQPPLARVADWVRDLFTPRRAAAAPPAQTPG